MFSRATKSVVKSFGSRRIHIDKKNFKIALIDDAGEISQTVSQLLINSAKLNTLALYDVAVVNKPLLANYNFCDKQPFKFIPSRMLTMAKKSCSGEGSHSNAAISMRYNNQQGNNGRNQIQKLVEALYHLPIAEEAPAIKGSLIPIEDLMPKAVNASSRMRPYARVLGEKNSSNVKTWQRSYATVAIHKCFFDLMYPSFQTHYRNFIPEVKISKKRQSKNTRKIRHSSYSALVVKENNRQLLSVFLLNHGEKSATRFMKKFKNVGILPNIEAHCRAVEKLADWLIPEALLNNKLRLLHKIYSGIKFPSSSLNFINDKCENNREVGLFNCVRETMTDGTLNIVEQENWIQRTYSKIKSVLPNLHAKIRLHSTTASESYCSENSFAVNQVIPFSNIISNSSIFFASKDCEDDKPKINIRKKLQEFCMQRKRSLKKNKDKNDICKKKERCNTMKKKCQKKEKICEKKRIDCSERRKQNKRNVVSCERRKTSCDKESVRDCCKTREQKVQIQEDPCKQKKDDISRTEEDSYRRLHDTDPCRVEKKEDPCKQKKDDISRTEEDPFRKLHNRDPCRVEKKEDPCKQQKDDISSIEEDSYRKLHNRDPCRVEKKEDPCKQKKDDISSIEEDLYRRLHDSDPCRVEKKEVKKEEIMTPDSKAKKIEPCEKKPCPTVKKIPECSKDKKEKCS